MSDEAIVVGARDEATAILRKVQEQTQSLATGVTQMASSTQAATSRMEVAFKGVAVAGAALTAIVGVVKGIGAIFSGGDAALEAFDNQAKAVDGLRSTLEGQGVAVDDAIARHQAFASQLQVTTNIGDEATLALMQQAALLGIQDDQLQDATLTATGLSEALGIGTNEALKKVNQALNGNAGALAEFIPEMRSASTEAERLAMISDVAQRGLQLTADRTGTSAGMAERAAGAWGDLQEQIGALIAPFRAFANEALATLWEQLQVALIPAIRTVNDTFAKLRPVLDSIVNIFRVLGVVVGVVVDAIANVFSTVFGAAEDMTGSFEAMAQAIDAAVTWVAEIVIWGITAVEVAVRNAPAVLDAGWSAIKLAMLGMAEDFKHTLTVAVPTYAAYFGSTLVSIITQAGQQAYEAAREAALLIAQTFADIASAPSLDPVRLGNLMSRLAGGGAKIAQQFEIDLAPLPTIAERAITDTEQQLASHIAAVGNQLGEEFTTKYRDRVSQLAKTTRDGLGDSLRPELTQNQPQPQPVQIDATNALSAVESRLLVRGRADDPIETVADNTRATVEAIQTMDENIQQLLARQASLGASAGLTLEVVS